MKPNNTEPTISDEEFLRLLGEARGMLVGYARMRTANALDAEDLYMETVSKAYENRARFACGTNFACWSRTIMRNTFLNDCKRKSLWQAAVAGVSGSSQMFFQDRLAQAAAEPSVCADDIMRAVERLPGRYRLFFRMLLAGYTYSQIAQRQGVTIDTVKSRIYAARKILREQLRDYRYS